MPVEPIAPAPSVREEAVSPARATVSRAAWNRLSPFWPAAVASVLLLMLMAVFVRRDLAVNDGHFIYPMDDAYGHMAIAKNLYRHGTWGFSPINGFSSGGSSLLWPLLLAGFYAVFGVHDWVPLALNLIPAVAFIFYAGAVIRRHALSGWASLAILLAVLYFTPLPTLAAIGMEHCWQILICLGFLDLAARALAADTPPGPAISARRWLPVVAFLMTMVRYEGLFLLGVVVMFLLYQRRWRTAALCVVAGGLPVVAFGLFAVSKGWHFWPNSLLLKTEMPPAQQPGGFVAFVSRGYDVMTANPDIFMLVAGLVGILLVQWRRHTTVWNRPMLFASMLLAGTLLHIQFAGVGSLYRYEAYLLGLGILTLGLAVADETRAALAVSPTWFECAQRFCLLALAVLLFAAPMWPRGGIGWGILPIASRNIYEQQFQMARFIRQSYRGQGVALNDIGAVSYFADIGLVDLWGLGTMEVTQAKLDHTYTRATVRGLLAKRDVRLIITYLPGWTAEYGGLPPEWVPVGQWTMPNNFVCGSPTVWFFAPNVTMVPELTGALQTYSSRLPPDIAQTGLYCGQPLSHVQGTYAPEKDGGGTFYWTNDAVQFSLYPSDERKDAMDVDSTLLLNARTVSKGVTLEVTFNGKVVATHRYAPDEVGRWIDLPVRVHWREGFNTVNIMAHGGVPKTSPGDDRQLLFAIHEPKWTFDDEPEEVHPLPTPTPTPSDTADGKP